MTPSPLRSLSLVITLVLALGLAGCSSDSGPVDTGGGQPPPGGGGGGGGGGGDQTSYGLIDDALDRGEIDYETSLVYKVFALYGDARLPEEYRGDDAGVREVGVEREIIRHWDQLSAGTQDMVGPFVVSPIYEGSWFNSPAPQGGAAPAPAACLPWRTPCTINAKWVSVVTGSGKARIWYNKDFAAADLPKANTLAAAFDNDVHPKLVALMGREPNSDAGVMNNGGDGLLDIVLVPMRGYGETAPPPGNKFSCTNYPPVIKVNRGITDTKMLEATLAHEMMHAIQWTFPADCYDAEYNWLSEATATWAEHYVYPSYNTEHVYADDFLLKPGLPLDDTSGTREYGAYLFFFYLQQFNARWVAKVWESATTPNPLQAIETALESAGSTNLAERWPEFARRNWNVSPIDKYNQWDGVTATAYGPTQVPMLPSAPDDTLRMDVTLPYLSAAYYEFQFIDDTVSYVTFVNGMKYNVSAVTTPDGLSYFDPAPLPASTTEGLSIQFLYKIAGQDWKTMDVTDQATVIFCRDQLEDRVDELVIVYANSDYQHKGRKLEAQGVEPFLAFSNFGCWKWQGTMDVKEDTDCEVQTLKLTGEWWTQLSGVRMYQPMELYGELVSSVPIEPRTGSWAWNISGACGGCSVTGSDNWPVSWPSPNLLMLYPYVPSGAFRRSFDISGISPGLAAMGTQHWTCPPPDGSYEQTDYVLIDVDAMAPDHAVKVSAGGKRISGTIDDGSGVTVKLNLTAKRE